MPFTISTTRDYDPEHFDQVIDVRSPSEFAEDHLPGAISLPVLSDEERAVVGTIYVQENRFKARKIGAALVARNAAHHLETALADKDGSFRPLVYCWRGGQRSGSFATILKAVGWRVEVLEGGYKAWRQAVKAQVYDTPVASDVVLLDGNTGTAKTETLQALAALGVQTIDLEGLANHRGSLFGAMGQQPSQKMFEGRLAVALSKLDPTRPVVLEAESSKVGERNVPPSIWKAMRSARRIVLDAPLGARATYLAKAYADIVADPLRLDSVLDQLVPIQGRERVDAWRGLAASGAYEALAAELMSEHYDPRYQKQRGKVDDRKIDVLAVDDLSPEGIVKTAQRVSELL